MSDCQLIQNIRRFVDHTRIVSDNFKNTLKIDAQTDVDNPSADVSTRLLQLKRLAIVYALYEYDAKSAPVSTTAKFAPTTYECDNIVEGYKASVLEVMRDSQLSYEARIEAETSTDADIDAVDESTDCNDEGEINNAMQIFLDAYHVNSPIDDEIAKLILMAFIGGRELSGDGLHQKLSAETGSGKSYDVDASLHCLPSAAYYKGAFTDKALIHDRDMIPGMIVKIDEAQGKSEIFENIQKEAISAFQAGVPYHVPHKDETTGDFVTITKRLQPRITFIILSVDSQGDEQTRDRFLTVNITRADTDKDAMTDFRLLGRRKRGQPKLFVNDTVKRAWRVLSHFMNRQFISCIPFGEHITYNTKVQRLQEYFESTIMYHAVLNYLQREHYTDDDGIIHVTANKEDFDFASSLSLFQSKEIAENKLTPADIMVIDALKKAGFEGGTPTVQDVLRVTNINDTRLSQIMRGRDGKCGLMSKVGISDINITEYDKELVIGDGREYERTIGTKSRKAYAIPSKLPEGKNSILHIGIANWRS